MTFDHTPVGQPVIIAVTAGPGVARVTYGDRELTDIGDGMFIDPPYCVHDVLLTEPCAECAEDA